MIQSYEDFVQTFIQYCAVAIIYPILSSRPAPREGHQVCRLVEGGALVVGRSGVEAAEDSLLVKFSNFCKKTLLNGNLAHSG